jgi:hypothetical protein
LILRKSDPIFRHAVRFGVSKKISHGCYQGAQFSFRDSDVPFTFAAGMNFLGT